LGERKGLIIFVRNQLDGEKEDELFSSALCGCIETQERKTRS
jgi:hypothetical protein